MNTAETTTPGYLLMGRPAQQPPLEASGEYDERLAYLESSDRRLGW